VAKYGKSTIGGRECMGMVNPADPTMAMHLSHYAFDLWAAAIVSLSIFSSFFLQNHFIDIF
jgi:hypothetical protein